MAEYLEILGQCAREVRGLKLSSDLPLTILSAATATAQELEEREGWVNASVRGRHLQISDSGHWIQLEHPDQVTAAVLEMVDYLQNLGTSNQNSGW
jgi:pimeloyl-ACP methyl ester carboxylesterase